MANTNRVNSYWYLKFLFFFIFVPKFVINTILLLISNYQYAHKQKEIFLAQRYQKINSWLTDLVSFKNIDYVFIDKQHLLNAQTLLICNKEVDLDNLYIFTHIFPNSSFVLQMNQFKKIHKLWKLLDINYDPERLSVFIKHKFSVVVTAKNEEEATNNPVIKDNYLSIQVISISEQKKKYFGKTLIVKFSPTIKPNNFLHLNEKALINKITEYL